MPQDIGFKAGKFRGVKPLKNGSLDCTVEARVAAEAVTELPLPQDMGFRDDNEGTEIDGREGMDGTERDGSEGKLEGRNEDPAAFADDAAAEAEETGALGTARSISCPGNARAESDCR